MNSKKIMFSQKIIIFIYLMHCENCCYIKIKVFKEYSKQKIKKLI